MYVPILTLSLHLRSTEYYARGQNLTIVSFFFLFVFSPFFCTLNYFGERRTPTSKSYGVQRSTGH